MSVSSVLVITGAIALSSASAETETNDTSVKDESTVSQAPVPTLYDANQPQATTTAMPVTTMSPVNMDVDRNSDGVVDAYEQCAFAQKKSEENCSLAKENIKRQMWQRYGSGSYNPNAFERNQNNGIIMKKMNEENRLERKEIKQEIKAKKRVLSDALHAELAIAVKRLPVEKLTRVIANIDEAAAKVAASSLDQDKKDNFIAQLEEIRVVIQDKINSLTGTGTIVSTGSTVSTGTVTQ